MRNNFYKPQNFEKDLSGAHQFFHVLYYSSLPVQLVDARGWNECTATHRAVADGNISILRVSKTTYISRNL